MTTPRFTPSSPPSASNSATATASARAASFTEVRQIPVTGSEIDHLYISSRYVAWAEEESQTPVATVIKVFDLQTNTTKVVATANSGAYVDMPKLDGDWLLYTELRATGQESVTYKTKVRRLGDQRSIVVDSSSGSVALTVVPQPALAWPWVVWTQIPTDPSGNATGGSSTLMALDLRTMRKTVLVMQGSPGYASIVGTHVIYDAVSGSNTRDIYSVSVDGNGPAKQLTTGHRAAYPVARGNLVTWREPYDSQPTSTWALSLHDGAAPAQVSGPDAYDSIPGNSFVVYSTNKLTIAAVPDGHIIAMPGDDSVDVGARWNAAGNLVVWATENVDRPYNVVIHVGQVIGA